MHYREAAVNLLTNPELDPYAHIPEYKVCAVSVARVEAKGQRPEARADRTLATQAGD
jgi:predicted molibdopterin-dependent oxidoreductase YjgC